MQTLTPIKTSAFLYSGKRLTELTKIRSASIKLLKFKKDRLKLEDKFQQTKDKFATRQQILDREKAQEKKKQKSLKGKLAKKGERLASSSLMDLLLTLVKIKALLWMADPNNVKILQGIVNFFKGFFKVIDFFATIGVEGVLGGLGDLVSPDSTTIQRLFAVFKIFGGFFILAKMLRWSNPFNAIKDLKKNAGIISRIFKTLASRDFKGAIAGIKKLLTPQIFRKGLGQAIQRVILKVFGKGGLKAIQSLAIKLGFKTATAMVKTTVAKTATAVAKRIPFIGPFIGLGVNLLMGTPLDVSAVRFAGAIAGEWLGRILFGLLGSFLGSVIPGAGTAIGGVAGLAVGGFIGNLIGEWIADMAYGWLKSIFGGQKKEEPALAVGGIVTKPTRALIGEAGPEAVIPLGHIYNGTLLSAPFGIIASSMIGGIDALLSSMGPIGLSIRPFAQQLLAPYTRQFGKNNYTFTSDIAKQSGNLNVKAGTSEDENISEELNKIVGAGLPLSVLQKKESQKQERYNPGNSMREILADILNNIINLDFTSPTSRPGPSDDTGAGTGGGMLPGDAPPEVKAMLDAIAGGEGSWDSVNPSTNVPGLSNMTIAEARIKALQVADQKNGSGAMGKWQQMPQFILSRARDAGLNPDTDKFNQENQTKIARMLMASVYPGGEAQLVKDAQQDPLKASAKLRGTWPSLPGGTQENVHSRGFLSRYNSNVEKYKAMQTGGVVNPIPSQNIATNKGGYAADTGLDILTPIGSRVVSPVSGILEYAEKGHVRQMGQDANPNMPGKQDQHSVRIKLDKPFTFSGKQVNYFYATHLYQLSSSVANKSGIKINAGDFLGLSGVANDVPHVHVGFVKDREQNEFLNYQQVRSLLSGAPIQDSGQDSLQNPTPGSESAPEESAPTWADIAPQLAKLAEMLNPSAPKIDSTALASKSMNFVQASKMQPLVSDTYIIPKQVTMVSSMNLVYTMPQTDYSLGSFSQIDSSSYSSQRRL